MFERLIKSMGQPANRQNGDVTHDPELQLATAQLLYGMLPADYLVKQLECIALLHGLERIFGFGPQRSHKLVARAAAAYSNEPNILASATLLKRRTSLAFRQKIMVEAKAIALADGDIHNNESDLLNRLANLLGLNNQNLKLSA